MAATAPPNLLTVKETARRLGLSPWSVYRRIATGDLPAVKLGSGPRAPVRVDADELRDWIYKRPEEA